MIELNVKKNIKLLLSVHLQLTFGVNPIQDGCHKKLIFDNKKNVLWLLKIPDNEVYVVILWMRVSLNKYSKL